MQDGSPTEPTRDGLPPMPAGPPHEERHFAQDSTVRDLATGAAEGLVLPFALTAALAGIGAPGAIVVTAGLAGLGAGALALGLGTWLAARTDADHYAVERRREEEESHVYPDREKWEVAAILHRYGVRGDVLRQAVDQIASDRKKWVDFMMRFELDLSEPDPHRAGRGALVSTVAFIAGGMIPLLPYMALGNTGQSLLLSCAATGAALLGFGWLRARGAGLPAVPGGMQAVAVGAAAAFAAYLAASLIG